ncbi:uncharacterized protein LOC133645928 [Entelurus aequoreus]|uniref:uncharacterized protein LOC133645928 n=1 Tax=Entelurus aequoreus TaxID=161455 RepID=UPI002B1D7F9D|nr:uncharacterized protein LOC133645928 [Entelurus aequoreus]
MGAAPPPHQVTTTDPTAQEKDERLAKHLETSTVFTGTSNRIQNDLIEAVDDVIRNDIKRRLMQPDLSEWRWTSIEKERLLKLKEKEKKEDFYNKVIEIFIQKERRMGFIYYPSGPAPSASSAALSLHPHLLYSILSKRTPVWQRPSSWSPRPTGSRSSFSPGRIPAFLSRPLAPLPRRKRLRRRGKRGGQLVKVRALLARLPVASRRRNGAVSGLLLHPRSLDPIGSWLVPIVGLEEEACRRRSCCPRPRRRGVDSRHLRAVCRAPPGLAAALDVLAPARFGLVNARSLTNKTFILKDFFTSRGLDFLCVTETWLRAGESAPLNELLPPECSYFNSPRSSGRKGGGLAVVFKNDFKCRQIRVQSSFSSFELCMFELGLSDVVLCVVVYRPPKSFLNRVLMVRVEIQAEIQLGQGRLERRRTGGWSRTRAWRCGQKAGVKSKSRKARGNPQGIQSDETQLDGKEGRRGAGPSTLCKTPDELRGASG